jgi:DNA invertase Pin-like site-specific DNA recombinase
VIKLNEIKSVAIYCRVSTEEQATEGYSISAQLQTLRQYAYLYGWHIEKSMLVYSTTKDHQPVKRIQLKPTKQKMMSLTV